VGRSRPLPRHPRGWCSPTEHAACGEGISGQSQSFLAAELSDTPHFLHRTRVKILNLAVRFNRTEPNPNLQRKQRPTDQSNGLVTASNACGPSSLIRCFLFHAHKNTNTSSYSSGWHICTEVTTVPQSKGLTRVAQAPPRKHHWLSPWVAWLAHPPTGHAAERWSTHLLLRKATMPVRVRATKLHGTSSGCGSECQSERCSHHDSVGTH
jgi:hypothetical protein